MSTKAQIKASIDTKLADASDILASELREVENLQLDEKFPTTTNYTLATGDFQHNLNFTKSGNFCLVEGFFKNGSGDAVNGEILFTIPDSIYFPKKEVTMFGFLSGSATGKRIYLGDTGDAFAPNKFKIMNGIGSGDIVYINSTYIVND